MTNMMCSVPLNETMHFVSLPNNFLFKINPLGSTLFVQENNSSTNSTCILNAISLDKRNCFACFGYFKTLHSKCFSIVKCHSSTETLFQFSFISQKYYFNFKFNYFKYFKLNTHFIPNSI